MRRLLAQVLLSAVTVSMFASAASGASGPSLSASFSPSTVSIGDTTQLTLTITSTDAALSNVGFSVTFHGGLNVAGASTAQCGGVLRTTPAPEVLQPLADGSMQTGAPLITLAGASVAAGGSCRFSVPVLAQGAGQLIVTTSSLQDDSSYALIAYRTSAVLTVPPTADLWTVWSEFSPSTIAEDGVTNWAVVIQNSSSSSALTGVRFYAPILAALNPTGIVANTCGGTGSVFGGISPALNLGPYVDYGGGTVPPGASCLIAVSMAPSAEFDHARQPATVYTNEGGPAGVSNAIITTLPPPTPTTPSNRFTHSKPILARDGRISETVTLPGPGTLSAREAWRGRVIARAHRTVAEQRTITVKLTPGARIRRALSAHHALTVKLSLTYTPVGGTARTATLTGRTPR